VAPAAGAAGAAPDAAPGAPPTVEGEGEVLDAGTVSLEAGGGAATAAPPTGAPAAAAELPGDAAAAGPPPGFAKGVYLGCFDAALLQMDFSDATRLAPEAAPTCIDHCRALRAPVYALSRDFRCLCLADAPHPAAALPRSACARRDAPAPAGAAPTPIFYVHGNADETCGVSHTKVRGRASRMECC
jgi:hypothetical protein